MTGLYHEVRDGFRAFPALALMLTSLILMGPLLLRNPVDKSGKVYWLQIAVGLLGTAVWGCLIWQVSLYV